MRKSSLDKTTKKAILEARSMIEDIARKEANEAETRRRIERVFASVMGYDVFKHISREHAVHGVGETEYCDFAVQLESEESSIPDMFVEIKRVGVDLAPKHLKQVASYAINFGVEWVLLTNGKDWRLYHIAFGKPPQTKLIESWDLLHDDVPVLAKKFEIVGYKNLKKQGLTRLWQKSNVLTPNNLLKVALSEESIKIFQRGIKKATDVTVSPEDIVSAVRHLLNEASLAEMDKIKISLPAKQQRTKTPRASRSKKSAAEQEVEAILADNHLEE